MPVSNNLRRASGSLALVLVILLCLGNAAWATYPGTNGRIVFAGRFTGSWQLYTVNPDGTDLFQVTNLPPTDFPFLFPDYSPDGRRIAFCHDMTGAVEIYVINADGTGLTQLTHDGAQDIFPRWTPDGSHITFSFGFIFFADNFYHHLVTMKDDGSNPQVITTVLFDDYTPSYTIDGKHLLLGSTRENLISAVWSVKPDGSQKKRLTEPAMEAGCPDPSPDGKHLVLCSQLNTAKASSIWVGDLDARHLKRLTKANDINALAPVYSPDGSLIVFMGAVPINAPFNMYIMNSDGSGQHLALSCADGCLWPDWGSQP